MSESDIYKHTLVTRAEDILRDPAASPAYRRAALALLEHEGRPVPAPQAPGSEADVDATLQASQDAVRDPWSTVEPAQQPVVAVEAQEPEVFDTEVYGNGALLMGAPDQISDPPKGVAGNDAVSNEAVAHEVVHIPVDAVLSPEIAPAEATVPPATPVGTASATVPAEEEATPHGILDRINAFLGKRKKTDEMFGDVEPVSKMASDSAPSQSPERVPLRPMNEVVEELIGSPPTPPTPAPNPVAAQASFVIEAPQPTPAPTHVAWAQDGSAISADGVEPGVVLEVESTQELPAEDVVEHPVTPDVVEKSTMSRKPGSAVTTAPEVGVPDEPTPIEPLMVETATASMSPSEPVPVILPTSLEPTPVTVPSVTAREVEPAVEEREVLVHQPMQAPASAPVVEMPDVRPVVVSEVSEDRALTPTTPVSSDTPTALDALEAPEIIIPPETDERPDMVVPDRFALQPEGIATYRAMLALLDEFSQDAHGLDERQRTLRENLLGSLEQAEAEIGVMLSQASIAQGWADLLARLQEIPESDEPALKQCIVDEVDRIAREQVTEGAEPDAEVLWGVWRQLTGKAHEHIPEPFTDSPALLYEVEQELLTRLRSLEHHE